MKNKPGRNTQENRILWLLTAAWPNWSPAPELARISLQYNARIFSLRRRGGWLIENRVRIVDGKKYGEFRLGAKPVPSSAELRQRAIYAPEALEPDLMPCGAGPSPTPPSSESLFGNPLERHRDDG